MWYSALILVEAKDEKGALQYAENMCDDLADRDLCDWAKTDSDWLDQTLELKDGSLSRVCRASEFEQLSDPDEVLYMLLEDRRLEDFSDDIDNLKRKAKVLDSLLKCFDDNCDPYLTMVAVHYYPIFDECDYDDEEEEEYDD